MFNGRKTKIFLLVTLLFLCMSVVAAEDTGDITVSDDSNTTISIDNNNIIEEEEHNEATQDSVVDNKEGLSSESVSYDVNSYIDLVSTINTIKSDGSADNNYTINLNNTVDESNYHVTETITWADATSTARNITINGNGITINGTNTNQFIKVSDGYTLILSDITITNCNSNYGGAINNTGNLTLINVTFTDNTASSRGGAIYNDVNGTVNIIDSVFTHNNASWYGGAIYSTNGTININNSIFTSNNAAFSGGVIYISNSTLNAYNTKFTQNSANSGGAIYNYYSTGNVINSTFTDNKATQNGGAIFNTYSPIYVNDSIFINNNARYGGAIYSSTSSPVNIINSIFTDNSADSGSNSSCYGGAIYSTGSTVNVNNSSFTDNSATTQGGVIYCYTSSTVNIDDSIFTDNTAENGGVIYTSSSSTVNINDSTFTNNNATDRGGAIFINGYDTSAFIPLLTINNVSFMNNTAGTNGGAIYIATNTITNITNTSFIDNSATGSGQALYINSSDTVVEDNYFSGNSESNGDTIFAETNYTIKNNTLNNEFVSLNQEAILNASIIDTNNSFYYIITAPNGTTINVTGSTEGNSYLFNDGGIWNISIYYDDSEDAIGSYNVIIVSETSLTVNVNDNIYVGYNVTISGVLNSTRGTVSDAQIEIYLNDELLDTVKTGDNGSYSLNIIAPSTSGSYNIFAYYNGDITYTNATTTLEMNVSTLTTSIKLDEINVVTVGQNITIMGILTDENNNTVAGQNITITINEDTEILVETDSEGKFTATYPTSIAGLNTLTAVFSGVDGAYNSSSVETEFNVNKIVTTVAIDGPYEVVVNGSSIIKGTLKDEHNESLDATIKIIIVNESSITIYEDNNVNVVNGEFTSNIALNTSGLYNIIVTYDGDDTHANISTDSSLTVNMLNTTITLDDITSVIVGEDVTITGMLDSEGTPISDMDLTVTINGESVPGLTTNSTGGFIITYTTTKAGENTIEVSFTGLSNVYDSTITTSQFDVIDLVDTIITVDNISDATIGDIVIITGVLEDREGNPIIDMNLTVTINEETSTITTDSTGRFTSNYTASVAGTNNVSVVFDGEGVYLPSNISSEFSVKKIITVITSEDVVDKYNNTITLTATVVDDNGINVNTGKVVFKLNGKTIGTADVVDGIATYTYIIVNNPKDYVITAKYGENSAYLSSETNVTLTVTNRVVDLQVLPLPEAIIVQDTVTINVIVSDESRLVDSGIVIFKVNGVTLRNEDGGSLNATVVNGIASITYTIPTSFSARNYTLTAVYSAKNYDRAEENTTFTVTKSDVRAQLDPLITAKGQKTTVTMTLYGENGVQIERDTKVSIKINGKTFTTITTTSGVLDVELPIDYLSEGYYNVTVVLGENSQYNTLRLETILIITSQTTNSENGTLTQE